MNVAVRIFFRELGKSHLRSVLKDNTAELLVLVKIRKNRRALVKNVIFRLSVRRRNPSSYSGKIKISRLARGKNVKDRLQIFDFISCILALFLCFIYTKNLLRKDSK